MSEATAILAALREALPVQTSPIPLHEPFFDEDEIAHVTDCVKSGWVSSVGRYVTAFEEALAGYCGVNHAMACVNGTAALHICLKLAGVRPADEVLCPSLTFVATANAISYTGAIPHFVDVDAARLTLCPQALRMHLKSIATTRDGGIFNRQTGARIAALVIMHTFGHPAAMDALLEVAAEFGLPVIEDAAESLGSYYQQRHTGTFGLLSALSFNGNKIITTGGGGAILTQNSALAARARHLTTTAKQPHPYDYIHDEVGYNYRLPNINAALGVAQLKKMPRFLEAKRALVARYQAALTTIPGVGLVTEPADSLSNYWLIALRVPPHLHREVLEATHAAGIHTRPIWRPMHLLPMYVACPRAPLQATEALHTSIINLPSGYKADLCVN